MSEGQLDLKQMLRDQVDEVARRWVLYDWRSAPPEGEGEWWQTALGKVGEQALAAGMDELAALAADLASLAAHLAEPGAEEAANRMNEGIRTLQDALVQDEGKPAAPQPSSNSLAQDPELVSDFLVESREHLSNIERSLLSLERNREDTDAIHAIFRAFHTIKGLAGFLEFERIREVSHETETLLDMARNGQIAISPRVIDVVLESSDCIARELMGVEDSAKAASTPLEPLLERIRQAMSAGSPAEEAGPAAPQSAAEEPASQPLFEPAPEPAAPRPAETVPAAPPQPSATKAPAPRPEAAPKAAAPADGKTRTVNSAIKVDTTKLDFLVDMVGELVIAQSLLRHSPELANINSPRLTSSLAQLTRITSEVQKSAMSMRMLPVGSLFQKMVRLVRDLCRKSGKQAEVELVGEDTELDRNIVEQLADPLMHMVRNSMDHGVEAPEMRRQAGKPETGRIRLAAMHQAGHIQIQVSDDGRGIDAQRVLAKAQQKGLVTDTAKLSETEILNLIFEPGFSTAEQVTDISGRGVGMDVVKKQIQKLRGRVDVRTNLGQGTDFVLKVPLTLAIIDGLVVMVGKERYIVPIFAVKEILKPEEGCLNTIENRMEIAMIRGRAVPVMRLHERFNVPREEGDEDVGVLIVSETRGKEYALMVDHLIGKQEVVIKSLGAGLTDVPGVAGGAILGDGRVGLILDMDGVFWRDAQ